MTVLPVLPAPEKKWLQFFIGLAVFVNFSGLFVTLMAPDAAVYAAISKNMLLRNDYFELYLEGGDWLDKPHFPFWVTAFFFKLFGVHTWSYKLPGILFVLMGAWYTYRFAREKFNETVALWSVFIFLTAEHIILSSNDVRAEPFLSGLIIAGIYHFFKATEARWFGHLVAGSLFAACAAMTKGIFTLIPIGGAVVVHLALCRQWKQLFNLKWALAIILTLIFLFPELYSLWYQFDAHPEKVVFGQTGVSGIRFFFWDSQFGRFMNTGPIKGNGDLFFFVHTLLWAFLPWSLLMYYALFRKIRSIWKRDVATPLEFYTLGGSLLILLVFSVSKFQLPHYANIIFPLLAIITAQYLSLLSKRLIKFFTVTQYIILVVAVLLVILLQVFYQPATPSWVLIVIIVALFILMLFLPRWLQTTRFSLLLYRCGLAIFIVNLYLNWVFYPDLLHYQTGSEAAFYLNKNIPDSSITNLDPHTNALEFYVNNPYIKKDTNIVKASNPRSQHGLWYVSQEELELMKNYNYHYEVVKEWDYYPVTRLTLPFVNKSTRAKAMKKRYIIRVIPY
ncbi:MAG: glycosyltransferase family 39 protein [Niastella sp.]|nr:glycosyltransferase family 39 protein [Niastella sp.]